MKNIFILNSEKELFRKKVNCNGTEMSLKRFNGETELEFVFDNEQRAMVTLSDDELKILHQRLQLPGFSTCESTQMGVSLIQGVESWRLAFLFSGKQDHETVKVYLDDNELTYLKILLIEKL